MSVLGKFLAYDVPTLARRFMGPGREADFRQDFVAGLKNALRADGLDPDIRLEETTLGGRPDARFGRFHFEFKSPGEMAKDGPRRRGLQQGRDYLEAVVEAKESCLALVTDGLQAALLEFRPTTGTFEFVDPRERPTKTGDELRPWSEFAVALERLIRSLSRPRLSSSTLLHHFGLDAEVAKETLRGLAEQFDIQVEADKSEFTKLLYAQWETLFALAVSFSIDQEPGMDLVELFRMKRKAPRAEDWDRAVFIVHTYYSLLLKLLALRIVDELRLAGAVSYLERVRQDPARGLLDAEEMVPRQLGNVIERDVFSWPYCVPDLVPTERVRTAISELATRMAYFDVHGVRTDVLRRVYQNLIPSKLRHSLGEFYTPTWAAELVLDRVGYKGEGRLLDPTCGSGTFLAAAIARAIEVGNVDESTKLRRITGDIVGFDLNPIAIATAKLNYVLVLLDVLPANLTEPLSLPIYLCDSLLPPEVASPRLLPYFRVTTSIGEIKIPLVRPDEPNRAVADTRRLLAILHSNYKDDANVFLEAVRNEFGPEAEENTRGLLIDLHKLIHSLHVKNSDGIWTGIIENFFAPRLQGQFDFVVGNPPWVIPRRTPKTYTDEVRKHVAKPVLDPAAVDYRMLRTRSASAERQYFACTPFVWRAIETYTTAGGKNAFLMTSSMLTAMGAGGWRRWISGLNVVRIIDMSLITDIHEGALCWSYVPVIRNERDEQYARTEFEYEFATPRHPKDYTPDTGPVIEWATWRATVESMPVAPSRAISGPTGPVSLPSQAPWLAAPPSVIKTLRKMQKTAETANSGVHRLGDMYPAGKGFIADQYKYFGLREKPNLAEGYADGTNQAGEKVVVERQFVFATAVGRGLRAWEFEPGYAFLPITLKGEVIPEAEMKEHHAAWAYLQDHKEILSARANVRLGYVREWYGVQVPGAAKTGAKVAFKQIAKQLEAALLPPTIPTAEGTIMLLPDQSTRIIPVGNAREALYLTGLLNSSPLRCLAYLSVPPKGGVPWRQFQSWNVAFLPIRKYDPTNKLCQDICDVSDEITKSPSLATGRQDVLDALVAKLYGITQLETSVMAEHLGLVQGHADSVANRTSDTISNRARSRLS